MSDLAYWMIMILTAVLVNVGIWAPWRVRRPATRLRIVLTIVAMVLLAGGAIVGDAMRHLTIDMSGVDLGGVFAPTSK
jgi:hypothetical protein